MGNGVKPPDSAEKSLGEIVNDLSTKSSLLVREEIELAKAEVQDKVKKLGAGAAAIAVAGFFLLMMLIMLLHAGAFGLADVLGNNIWLGYLIMAGALLLLAIVGGLLALRMFKRGSPPVPKQAIEEAKETRRAIEEARR